MTNPGDNIVGVEADVFERHVAKISAAKRAKDLSDAAHKDARQGAKAAGITLKSLDQAIMLANLDRDERTKSQAEVAQYANWLGAVEIGQQLDWISHAGPGPVDMEKAYGAGKMAGLMGEDPHGGHHAPGSQQYNKWMEGWHVGSKIYQEETADHGVVPLGPDDQDDAVEGAPALVDGGADEVEAFDPDAEDQADPPQEDQTQAFDEGWAASAAGSAASECPYETGDPLRGRWSEGFDKERASQQ